MISNESQFSQMICELIMKTTCKGKVSKNTCMQGGYHQSVRVLCFGKNQSILFMNGQSIWAWHSEHIWIRVYKQFTNIRATHKYQSYLCYLMNYNPIWIEWIAVVTYKIEYQSIRYNVIANNIISEREIKYQSCNT